MCPKAYWIVSTIGLFQLSGQTKELNTRQIIPEEFVSARPAKPSKAGPGQVRHRPTIAAEPGKRNAVAQLGMTIWRLRPPTAADSGVRILVHDGSSQTAEWLPERVSPKTMLHKDDRVRLTFESARNGYLYVIDREQYANGELGDPYLIFPTTRTRSGDNRVAPGRVFEIPGQQDQPNYLTVRPSRADQVGEVLFVIVAPDPLTGIETGPRPLKLQPSQVKAWQEQWGTDVQSVELTSTAGNQWTKAEQQAGASGTRLLTQDEPAPQTIYSGSSREGRPFLVQVRLQYGATRANTQQ